MSLDSVEPKKRVQPYHTATRTLEPVHLERQFLCHLPFESICKEQDDGTLTEHPAGPVAVEVVQRMRDARSTLPVLRSLRGMGQGLIRIPARQFATDIGQARGKDEGVNSSSLLGNGMEEVQEESGIIRYRA